MAAGAVLVQRTAWHNAQLALGALREGKLLDPVSLAQASQERLAALVRPAGFANAKARYLHAIARFFVQSGGVAALSRNPTSQLRQMLLSVHGVGAETADSILLYLFERPVWIVDAYAGRLLLRLSGRAYDAGQQKAMLSSWIEAARTQELQELHALVVAHGKQRCRTQPRCDGCPLLASCHVAGVAAATAEVR